MASLNKLAWPVPTSWHGQSQQAGMASPNKLAWPVPTSWHGQSQQAGMASLNKLAWPVSTSWHGQSHQAGMASRNQLVWPALTRELLAGTKNTQTVAGMASPHSLQQEPESDPSWHGQSQ